MDVKVVHHGGAVDVAGTVYPLKRLVGPDRLRPGLTRIATARPAAAGKLELELDDGAHHLVAPPGAGDADGPPDLVVLNIGQLLTMADDGLGLVHDASVACQAGRVVAAGPAAEVESRHRPAADTRILDARGALVTPGLVDPHTHPVYGFGQGGAGERHIEFGLKAMGKTYLEIHKAGGGILSTVRATRQASFEQLAGTCARNLSRLLGWGVTTIEGKSGYALETEGELRMLDVLRTVGDTHPVDVVPTLLGAHALPPERNEDRQSYVDEVVEQMIPRAAELGLARYCDAYCEDGAFTPEEVERIFAAAQAHGLGVRLHAEQFTDQGGAGLAARLGAVSADHLEAISAEGIQAMAKAGTAAVLLPGAALACRCPWPPARALLDAGVPVALGTDLNPGSSMTASLPLMMSLACMQMRVSCEEAWRAVTAVPAATLGCDDIGRLVPGSLADMVVFDADAKDYRYVPYHYGDNHVRVVVKHGQVVMGA